MFSRSAGAWRARGAGMRRRTILDLEGRAPDGLCEPSEGFDLPRLAPLTQGAGPTELSKETAGREKERERRRA